VARTCASGEVVAVVEEEEGSGVLVPGWGGYGRALVADLASSPPKTQNLTG
jgi:hypothetical protein